MNWILTVDVFPKTIKPYLVFSVPHPVATSAIVSFISLNVSSPYEEPAVIAKPRSFSGVGGFPVKRQKSKVHKWLERKWHLVTVTYFWHVLSWLLTSSILCEGIQTYTLRSTGKSRFRFWKSGSRVLQSNAKSKSDFQDRKIRFEPGKSGKGFATLFSLIVVFSCIHARTCKTAVVENSFINPFPDF